MYRSQAGYSQGRSLGFDTLRHTLFVPELLNQRSLNYPNGQVI